MTGRFARIFLVFCFSAHGKYRLAQRFKGHLSILREIPFGIGRVFGQFLPHLAYGIQRVSFQRFRVVSHRRNLLVIALKARPSIFNFCQVLIVTYFNYLQIQARLPLVQPGLLIILMRVRLSRRLE